MSTITLAGTFTLITCADARCGLTFAVPERWEQDRREDHLRFYCPNGHDLSFGHKTESEKLRDVIAAKDRALTWERERAENNARRAVSAEMSRRVTKGHLNKLRRRVGAGVCPCCNRTVKQLAAHMKSKHPDFAGQSTMKENDTP